MNCDQVAQKLHIPDDELSAEERSAIAEHAAACDACRALADELARLDAAVTHALAARSEVAPEWPEREADVMASIARSRAHSRWRVRAAGALAACLALVAGLGAAYAVGGLRAENQALRAALGTERAQRAKSEAELDLARKKAVVLLRDKQRAGTGVVVYQLFQSPPPSIPGRAQALAPRWSHALSKPGLKALLEDGGV